VTREDDHARSEFASEAEELLDVLSRDIGEFESQGRSVRPEVINKIFREVHSLKGLAGMLGFSEISELSHNLEDMLDKLRMGKIEITRELFDLLYDGVDSLNRLVIAISDPTLEGLVDLPRLNTRIHQLITRQSHREVDDPFTEIELDDQTRKSLTEYEEHRLVENIRQGREIYSISVSFDFSDFDERLRALTGVLNEHGEVVSTLPAIDASGGAGISFRLLFGSTVGFARVGELSGPEAAIKALRSSEPAVERFVGEAPVDDDLSLRSVSRTVRVDIGKLDHVMNVVGELIIEKTHLQSLLRSSSQADKLLVHELTKIARNFDRKLNEMQRSVIEIRMVPVGQIYSKLSRTVRKIARELGKEIELVFRGEETELDKMMVEELTDPLMHIIRNAIDHGIESPDERVAKGKSAEGNLLLEAYQKGNSVVIDVQDDGKGIDIEAVRRVAQQRGLLQPKEQIDLSRAIDLMFTPGFSTASEVSEISGRGVGLDVVKRNIQELKGTIDVLSEPGRGTTFRITLPITLAILQALIVRTGRERFAIPLTSVEESLRIRRREIETVERKEVYRLREMTIPLLRLSDAFAIDDDRAEESPEDKWFVVVTRASDRLIGILVDSLVRQQEIVIKSVGQRLKTIPGIAGATEIGENEIVLVIDTGSLIDQYGSVARTGRRGKRAS
jgi:two-component system, chemotaxis family, sensor kinase CheA